MAYQFYFDGNEIPITPGSVTITTSGNNKTVTLIDQGEINILKLPKLKEIKFDVLLPTQEYPFANNSDTMPSNWLDRFEYFKQNKSAFQFIIIRSTEKGDTYHGTSIRCSLEDYETQEDADQYGTDVNVSVTLKEYKDYGTKTVVIKSGAASAASKREEDNAPQTPASVETAKADNPVVMAKTYNNTSATSTNVAKTNGYGGVDADGSYNKNYNNNNKKNIVVPTAKSIATAANTNAKKNNVLSDSYRASKAASDLRKTGTTMPTAESMLKAQIAARLAKKATSATIK